MNTNDVIGILNDLAEMCRDGQDGFRAVADSVGNSEFRRLFNILARQRAQFICELQAEVYRLGGDTQEIGSEARRIKRGWTDRGAVERSNECYMIMECQPVEEAAVKGYEAALKANLPVDLQYVLKRQYMDIKDALDRIGILQQAA